MKASYGIGLVSTFVLATLALSQINGGGPNGGGGGGGGSVTSVNTTVPAPLTGVGCSYTTSGTCAITWTAAQTANRILASPSGTTGPVSLRAMTTADLPAGTGTVTTGSFTATVTGMTTTVTGTINYVVSGGIVTLYAPANLTGTSNFAITTVTGLVAAVIPTVSRTAVCPQLADAGNGGLMGICIVDNTGVISLNLMNTATAPYVKAVASFTTTGTKGIQTGWQTSYPL